MAAGKHGIEQLTVEKMIDSAYLFYEHSFYSSPVEEMPFNIEQFNSDMNAARNMIELLSTKDLLVAQGIHIAHVYIINEQLYDHEAMPEYLELLIKRELIKE
jgi:hypothetical protein